MSELKAFDVIINDDYKTKCYMKADADKVIAKLEDKLKNVSSILKETREWLVESQKLHKRCADNAVKVIAHSNYKRCKAMSKICENKLGTVVKPAWWARWHKRWLELALKFELKNGVNNA